MAEENNMGPVAEQEEEQVMQMRPTSEEPESKDVSSDGGDEEANIIIHEGDIFVYENGVIAMSVLAATRQTGAGKIYKVRLYSGVILSTEASEEDVFNYIANNGLTKLTTRLDQMEAVSKTLLLNQGDVFTKEGKFYLEILSNEMLYIDSHGESKMIIGIRDASDLVVFRDELVVKAMIFGSTDQFPPQN